MRTSASLSRRHPFPAEIISHCLWLSCRFALSYRDVEEIRAIRGVTLTYETVRQWCLKFGQACANGLRHRRPHPGHRWHLAEVFIPVNGRTHYLWRAVDQEGEVLDILLQRHRNKTAAKKFFRQLLKGLQYVRRVIITDRLGSYSAAKAAVLPSVEQRQSKGENNGAEHAHQLTRLREKVIGRFKSAGDAQGLLWAFGIIATHLRPGRHLYKAAGYREVRQSRLATRSKVTDLQVRG